MAQDTDLTFDEVLRIATAAGLGYANAVNLYNLFSGGNIDGVAGSGTTNLVAKWSDAGTIEASAIVKEDGRYVLMADNVDAGIIAKPQFTFDSATGETNIYGTGGLPDDTFRSLHNILKVCDDATEHQQLVQSLISGTVDTTSGPKNVWAGEYGAEATRVAGSNILRNTALLVHAAGAQENLAIDSLYGDWVQHDENSTVTNAGHTITGSLSIYAGSPGAVDFTNATEVTLGTAIVAPVGIPGAVDVNPQLFIGGSTGDGYQLVTRNTRDDVVGGLGGLQVLLDTTPDALARGGVSINRGASGGAGGNAKGLWVSGGSEFNPAAGAGDLTVYNQEAGKYIYFVTGGTGAGNTPLILGSGNKIGFYNTAPIAQQTGVAVTAAGIHAALVNLGLITA